MIALEQLLGADGARVSFEDAETLRPGQVHRLRFRAEAGAVCTGALTSLVVKRLSLDRAHREQRAVRLWLPRVGLGAHGAPLLEVAAARRADCVWHVYEDLGDRTLARVASEPGPARVRSLVALRRLESLAGEQRPLIDRLLELLTALDHERDARSREVAELGWPETLQHGDLRLGNFMLVPLAGGPHVRLIDWDRAGIGAAIYDLTTFLRQLPPIDRPWILAAYRECVERAGWPWPDDGVLNRVAETCELGRFASCLLWRTLSALELHHGAQVPPAWLFDDLVEMERWFVQQTPLLPETRKASAA